MRLVCLTAVVSFSSCILDDSTIDVPVDAIDVDHRRSEEKQEGETSTDLKDIRKKPYSVSILYL